MRLRGPRDAALFRKRCFHRGRRCLSPGGDRLGRPGHRMRAGLAHRAGSGHARDAQSRAGYYATWNDLEPPLAAAPHSRRRPGAMRTGAMHQGRAGQQRHARCRGKPRQLRHPPDVRDRRAHDGTGAPANQECVTLTDPGKGGPKEAREKAHTGTSQVYYRITDGSRDRRTRSATSRRWCTEFRSPRHTSLQETVMNNQSTHRGSKRLLARLVSTVIVAGQFAASSSPPRNRHRKLAHHECIVDNGTAERHVHSRCFGQYGQRVHAGRWATSPARRVREPSLQHDLLQPVDPVYCSQERQRYRLRGARSTAPRTTESSMGEHWRQDFLLCRWNTDLRSKFRGPPAAPLAASVRSTTAGPAAHRRPRRSARLLGSGCRQHRQRNPRHRKLDQSPDAATAPRSRKIRDLVHLLSHADADDEDIRRARVQCAERYDRVGFITICPDGSSCSSNSRQR